MTEDLSTNITLESIKQAERVNNRRHALQIATPRTQSDLYYRWLKSLGEDFQLTWQRTKICRTHGNGVPVYARRFRKWLSDE